jgi:site-specific recombinase
VIRNLVDATADVGDHYLDARRSSFRAAFVAGAGGGLLMVAATLVKIALSSLHLPTFYEGLVFSLNYASVFCAAYLLHYTIATKLPAHTAAALARSVARGRPRRERVAAFVEVARALVRLQFGGLLGNLAVAGPGALGAALVFRGLTRHPLIGPEKAEHLLHANSVLGPSAFYAVLTGIFLWASSLVGAGVENWVKVNEVSAALATGIPAMKTVGVARAEPVAQVVASKLGGLCGNAFLGLLLGGVPAAFAIAQIPMEIRHVTVSAASVALSAATPGVGARAIVLATIGVLVIGAVNVAVSFALALQLALRASEDAGSSRLLVRVGLRSLLRRSRRRAP